MAYPKIVYNAGSGPVTLPFTYPPVEQAGADAAGADEYEAVVDESVTESGLVQSVIHRIENFRTLNMNYVPNEDIIAWGTFMRFAIRRYVFSYYPDGAAATKYSCILAGTNWTAKFGFKGMKKFTLRFRLAATGQDTGIVVGEGGGGVTPVTVTFTSPDPLDPTGNFTVAHGQASTPTLVIPLPTDDGLIRPQTVGWDATNIYLNASAPGLAGVAYIFP